MNVQRKFAPIALLITLIVAGLAPAASAQTSADKQPVTEVVNINTATANELVQLPRVGPSLSQRILEFRKENGNFKKVDDLILVKGIGDKTFKNLEPFVVIEGKTTLSRKLRGSDVEAVLAARKGDGNGKEDA